MKKTVFALTVIASSALALQAQTFDVHKRPEAKAAKNFVFPKYTEQKLKNGLKVFIIEDHEQPTITMQLQLEAGTIADGDKSGLAEMTASLLTKGAGMRNALQIAEEIDGVGANVSASASGDLTTVSASGLKKHLPLILDIYSQVITHPNFPLDEFDKLVPQMIASVKSEKGRGSNVAQGLARKALYGENHPYARNKTEATIKSIGNEDVRRFYQMYYRPNNGSLAVVGDVTAKEIIPMLEKAFASWEADDVTKLTVPAPQPMPKGVYFVERPGSVQSSVVITNVAVPYGNPDYEKVDLAASYLGSGFGGRLFRTLRETYSYTYTPFGYATRTKYLNRTAFGADVRSTVTDSAIMVTMREIANLGDSRPNDADFNRIKSVKLGQYLMSFEDADFLASLLQNADYNGVPIERVKGYPERLNSYTAEDIQQTAKRYLNPENSYIVVVGSPDVKDKLTRFGQVYSYDLDLKKAAPPAEKINMDARQVLDRYTEALGGRAKLNAVNSLITTGTAKLSAGGQTFTGQHSSKKMNGKEYSTMDVKVFRQEIWVNNGKRWMSANGMEPAPMEGDELRSQLSESSLFHFTKLLDNQYKGEVIGKRGNEIIMKATDPSGEDMTLYFDANSFLLNRVDKTEKSPQGPVQVVQKFSDYSEYQGVKLPKTVEISSPMFSVSLDNSYQINAAVDETEFSPKAGK